jgi:hypothetical protein
MPMIELIAAGALTGTGRATVQKELAATLMRWEGAPDTAFFSAHAWSHLHVPPEGADTTAGERGVAFPCAGHRPGGCAVGPAQGRTCQGC